MRRCGHPYLLFPDYCRTFRWPEPLPFGKANNGACVMAKMWRREAGHCPRPVARSKPILSRFPRRPVLLFDPQGERVFAQQAEIERVQFGGVVLFAADEDGDAFRLGQGLQHGFRVSGFTVGKRISGPVTAPGEVGFRHPLACLSPRRRVIILTPASWALDR